MNLDHRPVARGRQRLPADALVEFGLGLGLRHRVPVREQLKPLAPIRRPAGRRDGWRLRRLADVGQNPLHRGRLGDEGNNAHVGAAVGARLGGRSRTASFRRLLRVPPKVAVPNLAELLSTNLHPHRQESADCGPLPGKYQEGALLHSRG